MRRHLEIGRIQAGHDVGLIGDVQRPILVRDVADGRLIGRDDERTVDEHRVGEMLCYGDAQRVEILNVAYARLHRHRHVAYLRVQSDVFDFADAPEQRLHLILGGLRCDVRHLYHLSGGCDGGIGAGRHCGARGSFQTTGACVCGRTRTIRRSYMFRVRLGRNELQRPYGYGRSALAADTRDRRAVTWPAFERDYARNKKKSNTINSRKRRRVNERLLMSRGGGECDSANNATSPLR